MLQGVTAATKSTKKLAKANHDPERRMRRRARAVGGLGNQANGGLFKVATDFISNRLFDDFEIGSCLLFFLILSVAPAFVTWTESALTWGQSRVVRLVGCIALVVAFDKRLMVPTWMDMNSKYVPRFLSHCAQVWFHTWCVSQFAYGAAIGNAKPQWGFRNLGDLVTLNVSLAWITWSHVDLQRKSKSRRRQLPEQKETETATQQQRQANSATVNDESTLETYKRFVWQLAPSAEQCMQILLCTVCVGELLLAVCASLLPQSVLLFAACQYTLLASTSVAVAHAIWTLRLKTRHLAVVGIALIMQIVIHYMISVARIDAVVPWFSYPLLITLGIHSLLRDRLRVIKHRETGIPVELVNVWSNVAILTLPFVLFYSQHLLWYTVLNWLLLQETTKEYLDRVKIASPIEMLTQFSQMT